MEMKPDPYGRDATEPLQIPALGWWQVAQRVVSESSRDNLSVVAAGCAFYALFAIFPALSALISLYGLAADPAHVEQNFGTLAYLLPQGKPMASSLTKSGASQKRQTDSGLELGTKLGAGRVECECWRPGDVHCPQHRLRGT